jgi:hypothetical protein
MGEGKSKGPRELRRRSHWLWGSSHTTGLHKNQELSTILILLALGSLNKFFLLSYPKNAFEIL